MKNVKLSVRFTQYKQMPNSEKGITSLIIFISVAVIFVSGVIFYGFWAAQSKPKEAASEVPVQNQNSSTAIIHPADPECPDTDYTGCDTSSQFMTWTDDGERNPTESESTIYAK